MRVKYFKDNRFIICRYTDQILAEVLRFYRISIHYFLDKIYKISFDFFVSTSITFSNFILLPIKILLRIFDSLSDE